jgi:hypothetical protein
VPGGSLITQDIDRQTLQVAYLAQYPQRGREIVHLGLIGGGGAALVAAYYLLWSGDAALLGLPIVLGAIAVTVLWFERALLNFDRNDGVARELFTHFGAYDWLLRHLLGPFFARRLRFLDAAERRRAAQHWDYLHRVRMPSAVGNGSAPAR